jgi:hypothetical protein
MNLKLQTFEVSDLAAIVGISTTIAKNWSLGKPLSITPSIRNSAGTGMPNLYSINDVYLMALINELQKAGIVMNIIKKVLDELYVLSIDLTEDSSIGYLLIMFRENSVALRSINSGIDNVQIEFTSSEKKTPVLHIVNLKLLLAQINDRAKELISRRKWDGSYKARALLNRRGVRKN